MCEIRAKIRVKSKRFTGNAYRIKRPGNDRTWKWEMYCKLYITSIKTIRNYVTPQFLLCTRDWAGILDYVQWLWLRITRNFICVVYCSVSLLHEVSRKSSESTVFILNDGTRRILRSTGLFSTGYPKLHAMTWFRAGVPRTDETPNTYRLVKHFLLTDIFRDPRLYIYSEQSVDCPPWHINSEIFLYGLTSRELPSTEDNYHRHKKFPEHRIGYEEFRWVANLFILPNSVPAKIEQMIQDRIIWRDVFVSRWPYNWLSCYMHTNMSSPFPWDWAHNVDLVWQGLSFRTRNYLYIRRGVQDKFNLHYRVCG